MEWGVKSLIWGVLSNGVCRDTKGLYIEPLLLTCIIFGSNRKVNQGKGIPKSSFTTFAKFHTDL